MQFENLHITDVLAATVITLKGSAGIYSIKCIITGAMYIGSSINLGERLKDHLIDSSNIHLRNAIIKYGASAFVFIVVEFVDDLAEAPPAGLKVILLSREQFYLNWLFSLPAELRYNFFPVAGSP
jgi:group I intron endonuclease